MNESKSSALSQTSVTRRALPSWVGYGSGPGMIKISGEVEIAPGVRSRIRGRDRRFAEQQSQCPGRMGKPMWWLQVDRAGEHYEDWYRASESDTQRPSCCYS
jgi:hypothetical protein